MAARLDWHVAVYAANEGERIGASLRSIADAMGERAYRIAVVVNGSRDTTAAAASRAAAGGLPVSVHVIRYGDKANAINQFIHSLREPARFVGQVDAYAVVGAGTFAGMEAAFDADPDIQAATGVAITGRTMPAATAATLSVGGQLHGQLHAFRSGFLDRMVARGIRLPIGLYRGDGLLGSMAAHDLDPAQPWRNERIRGVKAATYAIPVLSALRWQDIVRQYRREVRQARGQLENAAIKGIIYRDGYEALPEYASDMVAKLATSGAMPPARGRARWFRSVALREVGTFCRPDPAALLPHPHPHPPG